MISMIENACVENKKWISHDDMMNITVIAESTPGPIAINCATFVGYKQRGLIGAIVATMGIVFPSFAIIYLIAILMDDFLEITVIANAFKGIKLAVGILILDAALKMIQKMQRIAFSVAVTAVGWERILFYTGWMSSAFVYPASILLYILLFGLAMMRCRTITRAAGASLIASIVALLVWVFISAVDQYYGGPLVAMMTGWFGMQSIIVEETSLNIIAVLGGVLWPLLYTVTLFIATLFTKRRVPRYLK